MHVWCYWRRVLSLWRAPRPTAVSAVWRSMCYTRSACTGDSAATGLVTSLFFVIMAANGATMYFFALFVLRPSSFVASFVVHRPIFWGTYFSSSVLYLTTTVCKQRAANCEGHQRGETSPAVHTRGQGSAMPSSGCVVKRPRRAPVKAMTITQKWAPLSGRGCVIRKITLSVVSCSPRWVNTLKAINQRARLCS